MLSSLTNCLPWISKSQPPQLPPNDPFQDPSRASGSKPQDQKRCIFCSIPPMSDPTSPFKVVLESDELVAFHDRRPKGVLHLLTVTREHVRDVKALSGQEGAELVQRMTEFGNRALDLLLEGGGGGGGQRLAPPAPSSSPSPPGTSTSTSTRSPQRRLGFHIPPCNSVSHLHLHCLVEPLTFMGKIEFPLAPARPHASPPLLKGFGWFVEARQTREILVRGKRVRVGRVEA